MSEVIQFPVIARPYPPHVTGIEQLRKSRESKLRVQEMSDAFKVKTWRVEMKSNAMLWCDRMASHPNGGKQWVLQALDELRDLVKSR